PAHLAGRTVGPAQQLAIRGQPPAGLGRWHRRNPADDETAATLAGAAAVAGRSVVVVLARNASRASDQRSAPAACGASVPLTGAQFFWVTGVRAAAGVASGAAVPGAAVSGVDPGASACFVSGEDGSAASRPTTTGIPVASRNAWRAKSQ